MKSTYRSLLVLCTLVCAPFAAAAIQMDVSNLDAMDRSGASGIFEELFVAPVLAVSVPDGGVTIALLGLALMALLLVRARMSKRDAGE